MVADGAGVALAIDEADAGSEAAGLLGATPGLDVSGHRANGLVGRRGVPRVDPDRDRHHQSGRGQGARGRPHLPTMAHAGDDSLEPVDPWRRCRTRETAQCVGHQGIAVVAHVPSVPVARADSGLICRLSECRTQSG